MPDLDLTENSPYSNREIREKWHDITNSLSRIELQTSLTNGRVDKLERWRAFLAGCMTVITAFVVPVLGWALYVLVNINQDVHQAVDDALAAYEITEK